MSPCQLDKFYWCFPSVFKWDCTVYIRNLFQHTHTKRGSVCDFIYLLLFLYCLFHSSIDYTALAAARVICDDAVLSYESYAVIATFWIIILGAVCRVLWCTLVFWHHDRRMLGGQSIIRFAPSETPPSGMKKSWLEGGRFVRWRW